MRLAWLIPLLASGTAFAEDAPPPPTPPATTVLLTKNCKSVAKQKALQASDQRVDLRDYDNVTISVQTRPDDTVVHLSGTRAGKAVPDRVLAIGRGEVEPRGYIKPTKIDDKGTFVRAELLDGGPATVTYRLRMNRCTIEVLRGGRGDDGVEEGESVYASILLPPNKPIRAR